MHLLAQRFFWGFLKEGVKTHRMTPMSLNSLTFFFLFCTSVVHVNTTMGATPGPSAVNLTTIVEESSPSRNPRTVTRNLRTNASDVVKINPISSFKNDNAVANQVASRPSATKSEYKFVRNHPNELPTGTCPRRKILQKSRYKLVRRVSESEKKTASPRRKILQKSRYKLVRRVSETEKKTASPRRKILQKSRYKLVRRVSETEKKERATHMSSEPGDEFFVSSDEKVVTRFKLVRVPHGGSSPGSVTEGYPRTVTAPVATVKKSRYRLVRRLLPIPQDSPLKKNTRPNAQNEGGQKIFRKIGRYRLVREARPTISSSSSPLLKSGRNVGPGLTGTSSRFTWLSSSRVPSTPARNSRFRNTSFSASTPAFASWVLLDTLVLVFSNV